MTAVEIQMGHFADAVRQSIAKALLQNLPDVVIFEVVPFRDVSTFARKMTAPNYLGVSIRFSNTIAAEYTSQGAGSKPEIELRYRWMQWPDDVQALVKDLDQLNEVLVGLESEIVKIFTKFKPTLLP